MFVLIIRIRGIVYCAMNKLIFVKNVNIGANETSSNASLSKSQFDSLTFQITSALIFTQSQKSRGIIFIFCGCSESECLQTDSKKSKDLI